MFVIFLMICGLVLNVVADAFIPHVVDFKNFKKSFVAPRCVMQACCVKSITHTGMCCNTVLIYQVQNVPADISELWSIKKKGSVCAALQAGPPVQTFLLPFDVVCLKPKAQGSFMAPAPVTRSSPPACEWNAWLQQKA